jgi:hypothetical protein
VLKWARAFDVWALNPVDWRKSWRFLCATALCGGFIFAMGCDARRSAANGIVQHAEPPHEPVAFRRKQWLLF